MAQKTITTSELLGIVSRGEAELGRFISMRVGHARVRLVAPGGRAREVTVVDSE